MSDLSQARKTGRPTKDAAQARDERLLDVATSLFETRGYEGTSIEALAEAAAVGKPTVYARFPGGKSELFAAVYRRRVDRVLTPLADDALAAARGGDLEQVLERVAEVVLVRAHAPDALAFSRMALLQAERFPELGALAHAEGWTRVTGRLAEIMRAHGLHLEDEAAEREAADLFLSLVLGKQQQARLMGWPALDASQIRRRAERCAAVFLRGIRGS